MADYNRNRQRNYRSSNQEWNDESGQDRNYGYEGRGYGSSGSSSYGNRYEGDYGSSGSGRWGESYDEDRPYNRDTGYGRSYGSSGSGSSYGQGNYGQGGYSHDYDRDYSSGSYGNYGGGYRDRGRGGYGEGSTYGEGSSRYNRSMREYTPGGYGSSGWGTGFGGSSMYGGGYGSSEYGGTGSYYSGYGDRMRSEYDRDYGRGSYGSSGYYGSGSQYGGSSYGSPREDRNWWDKTTDEVSSWFGDEEAERRRRMDRIRGQHKGRGPKGYHRSDERIKEDVSDRLSDDSFIDASEIDVTVQSGEVVLTGTVDDRSTKRRAEDIAESVSGVVNVENRIRVMRETASFESSRTTGSSSSGMGSSSTERSKTKQSNLVGETSNK